VNKSGDGPQSFLIDDPQDLAADHRDLGLAFNKINVRLFLDPEPQGQG